MSAVRTDTARLIGTLLALTLTACAPTGPAGPTGAESPTATSRSAVPIVTPLLAQALAAPVPVAATDGRIHLAYELLLTNAADQDITVGSVRVTGDDRDLLELSGGRLADRIRLAGGHTPTATIGPGQLAKVWLDVSIDTKDAVPKHLSHQIVVNVSRPAPPLVPAVITENVAAVDVSRRRPVTITPPLRGPNWVDINGCCDMTPHRMALNPIDGKLWGAERFAIDYVQLDGSGRIFDGDRADPRSYPYFGTEIHAVADGPVVAVLDGLPEQVPGRTPTGLTLQQYGGNHVVQDIGGGNYAFYAHLQTGSVAVHPGDRLHTGQVLGRLGNSGNSDAPHLHFHVMDAPDPLRADGLPFVFDTFGRTGRFVSLDAADALEDGTPARLAPDVPDRTENDVSPLVLDVMHYGN